jgi:hypothetical protein
MTFTHEKKVILLSALSGVILMPALEEEAPPKIFVNQDSGLSTEDLKG